MNIKEAEEYIKMIIRKQEIPDSAKALGYVYATEALETVLSELENSISISKVEETIEELNQEIENCERRQNEVIALGGDDLHIREEIWDLEDKIHSLKQILEGLDVLKELQK